MKVINVSLICQRSLNTFKDKFVKNQMLTLHDLFHAEVKFRKMQFISKPICVAVEYGDMQPGWFYCLQFIWLFLGSLLPESFGTL